MARDHARLDITIWDDPDWLDLSCEAQRLYTLLLSQKDLSYCGLLPMRLRRWAKLCRNTTVDNVTAALAELHNTRFVLADHDTEEVLVRSLVRRDGIWKQPNTLAGAMRLAFDISSPILRAALAEEFRRLPARCGTAPQMVAAALVAGAHEIPPAVQATSGTGRRRGAAPPATVEPTALAEPATVQQAAPEPVTPPAVVEPVGEGAGNPSAIPSPNPSPIPSALGLGEGDRGQGGVVPLALSETQVQGVAPTRGSVHTREEAARLVAEHVPNTTRKVAVRLAGEVVELLAEGIAAEHVTTGLRTWAGKRLGVGLLPELVAEAMRAPVIAQAAGRSRSDDAVAAALELMRRMAIEDGELGEHDPAPDLAAVLGLDPGRGDLFAVAGRQFGEVPALAGVA